MMSPTRYEIRDTRYILLLASCFFLLSCGHSSRLLPSTQNTPAPLSVSAPVSSPSQNEAPEESFFDWEEERQKMAQGISENPAPAVYETPQNIVEREPEGALDPFIRQIVSFSPGGGAGFGQADMEYWLLGPPYGGGVYTQSTDVVSLGNGGEIVLGFPDYFPVDGEGPDFIIFENPFMPRGGDILFREPAEVAVSQDGIRFVEYPCLRVSPYDGCAGLNPVHANPDLNDLNPRAPASAGGDAYDLTDVGLSFIRYIRVRDANLNLGGDASMRAKQAGFDLDAIAIIHGAYP